MPYSTVIGLEIHCQLATKTKMFCGCKIEVNTEPNKNVCPGCLGFPGTLPSPNKEALNLAIKLGLALNCEIENRALWTRKGYFYPDLPNGYQITQIGTIPAFDHPICKKGYLEIILEDGTKKKIGIHHIHMEEDAGKLVHDFSPDSSHFDANRCGTPLCEIVTQPDMRNPEEAVLVLQKIKQILEYTGASNANMENGNLRCDGNISIRKGEDAPFGTRVEIKNLNSFSYLQKALEAEIALQSVMLDSGREIEQCTKRFDANHNKTITIRRKEDAHDYKYFPEPDLLRLYVEQSHIDSIKQNMPELPDARRLRFESDFGLSQYDAQVLTSDKEVSDWFDTASKTCKNPKILANWVTSELMRELKETEGGICALKFKPEDLAQMVNLIENSTISGKIGKTVFAEMLSTGKDPDTIIKEKGLVQITDTSAIEAIVRNVIEANQSQWQEFKGGKAQLRGFFVGQIMKNSGGKANPGMVNRLLDEIK
ncbi:MAG: Asp-tRNA(Asn)/Glu-tRNA(Gln) amidotransferase subunit GatB [Fibromonadales bacterium]|nr:Asp-tRNA(Asn)/Glu-tRNA(Gln) amidotransferase subunit GatB [Fibromonadales bacterium]